MEPHEALAMDFRLPPLLSGSAVKAQQVLHLGPVVSGRQEDKITPEAGRAVASTWNICPPDHVLRPAPFDRWSLSWSSDVVPIWAAPPGPIAGDWLGRWKVIPIRRSRHRSASHGRLDRHQ
jgi:hypothetical protein